MKEETTKYTSKDVVWAVFLIFIGTIFLLNTTGVLDWGIWLYLLSFWPIFLILAGLKLILGNSLISDIVLSISALILFLLVGIFSFVNYTQREIPFLPRSVNLCLTGGCMGFNNQGEVDKQMVVTQSDFPDGVDSREMDIRIGAASFDLTDSDVTNYLTVRAQYPSRYIEPTLESKLTSGKLEIDFESATGGGLFVFNNQISSYDFVLGNISIPTDLNIDIGAGEGSVELDQSFIKNIDTRVGAGKLEIFLERRSLPREEFWVDIGAGELILNIPEDVGYELEYDLGIGNISENGKDIASFVGDGENYRSENYDSSDLKIKIYANVGVGKLAINTK